jgi:hypothetical protein
VTTDQLAALDLIAARAAVKQYRKATRRHIEGERYCLVGGWFDWAMEERRFAAVTGTAALMERLGMQS